MSTRFRRLFQRYFSNTDYIMLYIDSFLSNFANSIYQVFTPVILYQSGISISIILFLYALQFWIMGVFTPLSGVLIKKYGIATTKLIGYILKATSLLLVFTLHLSSAYYILIPITYGISGAINNPLKTYLPSKLVQDYIRGRFNALIYILNCISSVFSYIFVIIFLPQNHHFFIMITILICYFLSVVALFHLSKNHFYYQSKDSFKECYLYLFKNSENQVFKRVSGLRSFIIIERLIAVPLYLYISLNDLRTFVIIYIVSTVLELISLIISGKKLDYNKNTFSKISSIKGFVTFVFLIVKEKSIFLFNQSFYSLSDHVYDSAYSTLLQSKVKSDHKNTLILSMVHEMSLCFYEFCVLIILSIIAHLGEMMIFQIVFISSILVVIVNCYFMKNWRKEEGNSY